jgi:hypothetical protein
LNLQAAKEAEEMYLEEEEEEEEGINTPTVSVQSS